MRKNLPITNKNKTFPPETKLISVTDIHGNISDCNDAFAKISGFSKDELIGQPHNIVRHPDMPPLAFEVMWSHLKSGKPWMGLVKNRCKDGDYYWVDAYVTPVTENGKVVGFESVRSNPKPEDIKRAEQLYARINAGKGLYKPIPITLPNLFLTTMFIISFVLFYFESFITAQSVISISVIFYAIWSHVSNNKKLESLSKSLTRSFSHELAVQSYTKETGLLGKLEVAIISQYAHLTTVISRIENAAQGVSRESLESYHQVQNAKTGIDKQQSETSQVATAINEMSTSITEVTKHVSGTARQAEIAFDLAKKGEDISIITSKSIDGLRATVQVISTSITEVADQTKRIADAANMIEQIADQTNLLALNAAIEAARAGEHGRGFAVVADEVRTLAQNTQNSTSEIYNIVSSLTAKTNEAVKTAEKGNIDATKGLEKVLESAQMLKGIVSAIGEISDMSAQIATAVEEQSYVSEDINKQVVNISNLADSSAEEAHKATTSLDHLKDISDELHELVVRFK
ncbi:methyl-accepting chemotaxis protein [Pseudoalteromonas distincta]|uniref:methyl-accepting chemotaxis protein n=1 Tax=Pseudoalteromonas distincta TaxID=77608 RepID=UPI0032E275ED